jgi:hypothetical protein
VGQVTKIIGRLAAGIRTAAVEIYRLARATICFAVRVYRFDRNFISSSLPSLSKAYRARDNDISAEESASNIFRFFRSKHVVDLKIIATLVVFLFSIYFAVLLVVAIAEPFIHLLVYHFVVDLKTDKALLSSDNILWLPSHGIDVLGTNILWALTYAGPAIPVCGGVVAWAYLSAGTRLGVVDLFACEIRTLCRVGTAFDVGTIYITRHQDLVNKSKRPDHKTPHADHAAVPKPPTESKAFSSHEEYFPVFSTNSGDLESLEALVVGNITEFYTYMKATRDLLRALAAIDSVPDALKNLEDLIYVLFLGYESGRKSVEDLVEFEPTRAENMIVILITELTCYSFLCEHFTKKKDKARYARLELRERAYNALVKFLIDKVNEPHNDIHSEYWDPAKHSLEDLERCHDAASKTLVECKRQWHEMGRHKTPRG